MSKIRAVRTARARTHKETKRLEYSKNEMIFFNILIVIKNIKKDA